MGVGRLIRLLLREGGGFVRKHFFAHTRPGSRVLYPKETSIEFDDHAINLNLVVVADCFVQTEYFGFSVTDDKGF